MKGHVDLLVLAVLAEGPLHGYAVIERLRERSGDAFDAMGFPIQVDGASTVVPGLHFVGVHFLRRAKSALLMGVGEDAAVVAQGVADRLA